MTNNGVHQKINITFYRFPVDQIFYHLFSYAITMYSIVNIKYDWFIHRHFTMPGCGCIVVMVVMVFVVDLKLVVRA